MIILQSCVRTQDTQVDHNEHEPGADGSAAWKNFGAAINNFNFTRFFHAHRVCDHAHAGDRKSFPYLVRRD